jgi:hypothetical protein
VRARGVVGASVAGVHALGATSPFDGVTVGLGGVQTGCGVVVVRKSLTLGTGPIDLSLSFAQSNCRSSSGVTSGVV